MTDAVHTPLTAVGFYIKRGDEFVASLALDSFTYEQDARRLVACWNALEGISTEKLEKMQAGEFVGLLERAECAFGEIK